MQFHESNTSIVLAVVDASCIYASRSAGCFPRSNGRHSGSKGNLQALSSLSDIGDGNKPTNQR